MSWADSFNRSVDYLESRLAGRADYRVAAQIAGCSLFQYQRMFSYVAGVPLGEYMRRRRMALAALDLKNSGIKIQELARKYGYESPDAFGRAFQKIHHITPCAARRDGTKLKNYSRLQLHLTVSGADEMEYRIEESGPLRVAGVRMTLSCDMEVNFKTVPAFWEDARRNGALAQVESLRSPQSPGILGVTLWEGADTYSYFVAAPTDQEVPAGMELRCLPESVWAVFECSGPMPGAIQELYRRFYTEWLPCSGFEYTGLADMEVYQGAYNTGGVPAELWLSVNRPKVTG